MIVISVDNVNQALSEGLFYLLNEGVPEESRNGRVIVAPGPVTTIYQKPQQRVLFSPLRDANPFFHMMESLWMLAGQRDLAWPQYFNSNFSKYSDDGVAIHGAYGYRWRHWFGYDQLAVIAVELTKNPNSRRCVLSMWDASVTGTYARSINYPNYEPIGDPGMAVRDGKDVPCNTHAYFDCRDGKLNMTVCCRSNDIIWGAYGANAVHFSMLQEVLAAKIGVSVGVYRQMSNNYHAYTNIFDLSTLEAMLEDAERNDLYNNCSKISGEETESLITHSPVVEDAETWFADLAIFMNNPLSSILDDRKNPQFFTRVARPMFLSWQLRKRKAYQESLKMACDIAAPDWRSACVAWINRREEAKKEGAKLVQ
jgi:thymidylate synthase